MIAGLNFLFKVWRMTPGTDDYVGGASITGTVVYDNIPGRMQEFGGELVLLQQGLETLSIFNVTLMPGNLDIRERDEIEVVEPFDHPEFGNRFRVIDSSNTDLNVRDPRNYMMLTVSRSDRAHTEQ